MEKMPFSLHFQMQSRAERDIGMTVLSVRLFICPSHSDILAKLLNIMEIMLLLHSSIPRTKC